MSIIRTVVGAWLLACCVPLTNCGGRSALDAGEYFSAANTGGSASWGTTLATATGGTLGYIVSTSGGFEATGGAARTGGGSSGSIGMAGATGSDTSRTGGAAVSGGQPTIGGRATGGQPAGGGCAGSIGSEQQSLIDDLESGTGRVPATDGRIGVWYAFDSDDGTQAQVPAPTTPGVPIIPEPVASSWSQAPLCASKFAMHTTGAGYTWAGIGFDLKFDGTTYGSYDASAFDGITFVGAGTPVSVRISTTTTTSTKYGGTCTLDEEESNPNEGCQPHSYDVSLDNEFSQHWVPFKALTLLPGEWHTAPDFEPKRLTNIQFYTGGIFDFWVDNVSFYAGRPGCCDLSPTECNGVIDIPNASLKKALGQGDLTCSDVCFRESFYDSLETPPSTPQNLAGLQCLIGLRRLIARNYGLDDIRAIANLSHLYQLDLTGNRVTSLQALSSLTNLGWLDLGQNQVSVLTPLANLKELASLTLSNNSIVSLDGLQGLAQLQLLSLDFNEIVDITPLSTLAALDGLDLSDNAVVDVAPLSSLSALTSLDLSNNQIKDASPLSNLTGLITLELNQNQIASLAGFGNLPYLPRLDLSNNQISDLANFGNMAALTSLNLSNNRIASAAFGNLPLLMTLDLSSNAIEELTRFGNLPALTTVDFSNNAIRSPKCAGGLPKLTIVDFSNNNIESVTGIGAISSLSSLDLSNNQLRDFSSFSELALLESLEYLNLAGNPLGALENVPTFEALKSINLSNTGLSSAAELGRMHNLTSIYLSNNQLREITFLQSFRQLNYLDLSNNQISDLSPFLSAPWGPPVLGNRYSTSSTLNVKGNPIDCVAQATNLAALRAMTLNVVTDCPWL